MGTTKSNTERFTGRVEEYVQYRERYDPEVVLPLLRSWCGLQPEWLVADVGAGTGMLSDVFLANGNRVLAVEPNAEMRAACAKLHEGDANLTAVDGSAEQTGLASGSVDVVSVGRALHWFRLETALQEFRRVLKPRGWVVVVAFGRAEDGREENEAFELLLRETSPDRKSTRASYVAYQQLEQAFVGGERHHEEIRGEMRLHWEALRGMTLSLSHAPLESDARFPEFEKKLRAFFDKYAQEDVITMATRYWINAGRFA